MRKQSCEEVLIPMIIECGYIQRILRLSGYRSALRLHPVIIFDHVADSTIQNLTTGRGPATPVLDSDDSRQSSRKVPRSGKEGAT